MNTAILFRIKLVLTVVAILTVVTFSRLNAQPNSIKEVTDCHYALENLLEGIKSENDGVKRSSIYFAGKYKIYEAENLLIEQLEREQNPCNRILIALVLYEVGSNDGLLAVKNLAAKDSNSKVRRMCTHIYREYLSKFSERNHKIS